MLSSALASAPSSSSVALFAQAAALALGVAGGPCAAQLAQGSTVAERAAPLCALRVPGALGGGSDERADARTVGGVGLALVLVALGAVLPTLVVGLARRCGSRGSAGAGTGSAGAGTAQLYLGHAYAMFGERMWELGVPLLFVDLFRDTLLPTSLYALIVYLAVVQLGPYLGAWTDKSHRLEVQLRTVWVENACVLGTGVLVMGAALSGAGLRATSLSGWALPWFGAIVALGCAGEVASGCGTTSLERDWVVVIAQERGVPVGRLNTVMRRIDLTCLTLGPVPFALLYELFGEDARRRLFFGAALLVLWNAVSWPIEASLLRKVFVAFPALARKSHEHCDGTRHSHEGGHVPHGHLANLEPARAELEPARAELEPAGAESRLEAPREPQRKLVLLEEPAEEPLRYRGHTHSHAAGHARAHGHAQAHAHAHGLAQSRAGEIASSAHIHGPRGEEIVLVDALSSSALEQLVAGAPEDRSFLVGYAAPASSSAGVLGALALGLGAYRREMLFLASVAYTLLYMTVLDQGALITSYLQWAGVRPWEVALGRSAGAVSGLLGTFCFPWLVRWRPVAQVGLLSIWLFWLALLPGVLLMAALPTTPLASHALVVSMAGARCWLWIFDLVITELCQEHVAENNRATFGSVQASCYNLCFIAMMALGVLSPRPQDFVLLVLASAAVMLTAALLYTAWFATVYRRRVVYEAVELAERELEPASDDPQRNAQALT